MTKESMRKQWRKPHYYPDKGKRDTVFDEVLKLLKGSIGQKWDNVYSKICTKYKGWKRSRADYCIELYVDQDTIIKDGKLYDSKDELLKSYMRLCFYVCPRTQTLQKFKRKPYRREKKQYNLIELDNQLFYKYNNIWYRVKASPLKQISKKSSPSSKLTYHYQIFRPTACDVFYPFTGSYNDCCGFFYHGKYGKYITLSHKEQANSKEVKRLNNVTI